MLCDELKTQSLREMFSPKREIDKLMLPQEVNRFPDSRLSFVLLTIVFRKLSSAFMLACVILSSSDGIK